MSTSILIDMLMLLSPMKSSRRCIQIVIVIVIVYSYIIYIVYIAALLISLLY